jgi:hypothetical protein
MKALLLGLVLILGNSSAQAARIGSTVPSYEGHRIASLVPTHWLRSEILNGTEFVSPDRTARLRLTRFRTIKSKAAHMRSVAFTPGERITYLRRKPNWIVVSGFKGNRIFYRRANLVCRGQHWHQLSFEYPATQKRNFDRFVTRASHSLGRGAGCA